MYVIKGNTFTIILVIIYNDDNKINKNYDCNYLLFISILFHLFLFKYFYKFSKELRTNLFL